MKILAAVLMTVLAAALLATVLIPKVFGLVPLAITSESMAPTLPIGTMVVVQPVTPEEAGELDIGTVVTFQDRAGGPYITHRIVGVSGGASGIGLVTQGDANNTPDAPLTQEQVHARMVYSVPLVGMLAGSVPGEAKSLIGPAAGGLLLAASGVSLILQLRAGKGRRRAGAAMDTPRRVGLVHGAKRRRQPHSTWHDYQNDRGPGGPAEEPFRSRPLPDQGQPRTRRWAKQLAKDDFVIPDGYDPLTEVPGA